MEKKKHQMDFTGENNAYGEMGVAAWNKGLM